MRKTIAISSQKSENIERLQTIILDYSRANRTDEGKRQGAWIFEKDTNTTIESIQRAVVKIHKNIDIDSVLEANKLMSFLDLQVPFSFSINESASTYQDLAAVFIDGNFIPEHDEYEKTVKQCSNSNTTFLVMDFVSSTTFSDLLVGEFKIAIETPHFWNQLGKALLCDLITGNEDRLIELNTGNWMIDKESQTLVFIDNEVVKNEKPELLDQVKKIVSKQYGTKTLNTIIKNILTKFNIPVHKTDINRYENHMYGKR